LMRRAAFTGGYQRIEMPGRLPAKDRRGLVLLSCLLLMR